MSLADKLHNARASLNDLLAVGHAACSRFNADKGAVSWYYDSLAAAFEARDAGLWPGTCAASSTNFAGLRNDQVRRVDASRHPVRGLAHGLEAPAGTFVHIPKDVVHSHWNATAEPVRLLRFPAPSGFEMFFTDLADLMSSMPPGPPDMSRVGAVYEKYGLRVMGPPPSSEQ